MPALHYVHGIRFSFYSNESNQPAPVRVTKGEANGKIWLEPAVSVTYLYNITRGEHGQSRTRLKITLKILKKSGMSFLKPNHYDAIERVIFETGIRITALDFDVENDKLNVTLSSKVTLHFKLFAHKMLRGAERQDLMNYELVAGGLGVHWPTLDEDLSLKGFLEEELKLAIGHSSFAMAA